MITLFQAIVLGLAQGITELFPISSLGHTVLLPGLFGWNIDQNSETFLEFLVATHFATAIVLFVIYFKDWVRIVKGMVHSFVARDISDKEPYGKLGWLLVVSTIPAGIIGLILKDQITGFLLSPLSASIFLALNGILLFIAERFRTRARVPAPETLTQNDERIARQLTWWQSAKVGILQVLALIPGFSRTGSTLAGGLMVGLSHEDSLRYSFLLATPIIGAAALLELPPLLSSGNSALLAASLAGAVAAAVAAWASAKFLARYFKTKTLIPFAIYCLAMGIVSALVLTR